jgi:hypothetical protein
MDGPPALGLSVGLTTPHRKKEACYETTDPRTWTHFLGNDLSERIWT